MPARRDSDGKWRYRKVVIVSDGTKVRVSGTPTINSRVAAEAAERAHIERVLEPRASSAAAQAKEVPTFGKWFNGRFWEEWVIGRKNKHSEQEAKRSIFKVHLGPAFGDKRIDQIGVADVAGFRAELVKRASVEGATALSEKRINNILAVLSKSLRYAVDVELIAKAPKVGLFKVEPPEIVCWDFEEYARILEAAKVEGPEWYAAVCLAGEAALRVGEVKALRWQEDVDLVAGTITVNQQIRRKVVGTPKGRTRRTVPMTDRLRAALKAIPEIRTGFVLRNVDGTPVHDQMAFRAIARICRRAGLPSRQWHTLRHSFGTHAAMLGVNPWQLMTWMGHKRIEETMRYVHFAGSHMRPIPAEILAAGARDKDPSRGILAMLGCRGKTVAKEPTVAEEGEEMRTVK